MWLSLLATGLVIEAAVQAAGPVPVCAQLTAGANIGGTAQVPPVPLSDRLTSAGGTQASAPGPSFARSWMTNCLSSSSRFCIGCARP